MFLYLHFQHLHYINTTNIALTFALTIYLLIMLLITYTTYTCTTLQYGAKTSCYVLDSISIFSNSA